MHFLEDMERMRQGLHGAPRKLAIICCIQAFVLVVGVFVGHGGAECQLAVVRGGHVDIDCNVCRPLAGLRWRDTLILIVGLGVIGLGVYSALFHDMWACRTYGLVMLCYAFILGLTAVLTGLQAPVISAAANQVVDNDACQQIAYMMADNIRYHAVLYGFSCVLNCAGAVYAILSKQLFDYENMQAEHRKASRHSDNL
jgi:hypothetical protein